MFKKTLNLRNISKVARNSQNVNPIKLLTRATLCQVVIVFFLLDFPRTFNFLINKKSAAAVAAFVSASSSVTAAAWLSAPLCVVSGRRDVKSCRQKQRAHNSFNN